MVGIIDIFSIREMYATGNFTQRILAKIFAVGPSQISNIVNNKRWVKKS